MTLKQAIKKAEDNGYDIGRSDWQFSVEDEIKDCILDPEFWKSLEKGLCKTEYRSEGRFEMDWKRKWHKLIDHLADGGSIKEYFKEL